MSTNTNKVDGNNFEDKLCKALFKVGYWAHNLAQNRYGQPADIIAGKNGKVYLIDAKVVSTEKGFELSRMEDNQDLAMSLWEERIGNCCWFCIWYKQTGDYNDVFMVSHDTIVRLKQSGKSYLTFDDAQLYGVRINYWIELNGS